MVELSGVIAAPIITFDRAVLEIPFINIPGPVPPTRS
jgi:hypothetical protein